MKDEEYFDPDAHSCRDNMDENGFCTICGAVVPGTWAYYELYGGEPPESNSPYSDFPDLDRYD